MRDSDRRRNPLFDRRKTLHQTASEGGHGRKFINPTGATVDANEGERKEGGIRKRAEVRRSPGWSGGGWGISRSRVNARKITPANEHEQKAAEQNAGVAETPNKSARPEEEIPGL